MLICVLVMCFYNKLTYLRNFCGEMELLLPVPKQLYVVCGQHELRLFQKLKLLQKSSATTQPTVDGRADSETVLTRLAPEGASSNSVGYCSLHHLMSHLFHWIALAVL